VHTFAKKPVASPRTATVNSAMPIGRAAHEILPSLLKPSFGYDIATLRIHSDSEEGLAINEPGDAYEQEADHVADQVMGMSNWRLQSACEQRQAHRLHASAANPTAAPPEAQQGLRSSASPLGAETRAFMEPRFGHDFAHIRIHADAAAARSAEAISARAYTIGSHVFFGANQYRPQSQAGLRLIAHELTHVMQQTGSVSVRGSSLQVTSIGSAAKAKLVQRDAELDESKTKTCLAQAEEALKKLEATAAKPDYPLPDYIKDAIKLLRKKMTHGKIKCYAFSGLVHGQFKGDEIRIDGITPDSINVTTLLHEAVHALHKEKSPKAGKAYGESEGKSFKVGDPKLPDLLRWKAYTEYWAYRARFDYFNPSRSEKDKHSESDIHKMTMSDPGVKTAMHNVWDVDPDFDPKVWKPKG
jgi:hypothetical protein